MPNLMLEGAFLAGRLDFAAGYRSIRREVRLGQRRVDAVLEAPDLPRLWVECKSAALAQDALAMFPDCPTARGRAHLLELIERVRRGERAAMFYFVQREGAASFAPAAAIDPEYAALMKKAVETGVIMRAYAAIMEGDGTRLGAELPVIV